VKFNKESDMAAPVIALMEAEGWDVYQEVQAWEHGPVCDLVGRMGDLIWCVEMKLSLSLALLEQAYAWKRRASYVSIAVPLKKSFQKRRFVHQLCNDYGIGIILARPHVASIEEPALLNRTPWTGSFKSRLCEDHKTFAVAGNAEGARYSPFQKTKHALIEIVINSPGITMKAAVETISHHYVNDQSARSSLAHWINAGKIKGIRAEGKPLRLYYEEPGGEIKGALASL